MSSKTKKKATGGSTPAAPAAEKKVKLPKQYIARPATPGSATVLIHPEVASAMDLNPGQFVVVKKEGAAGVLATLKCFDNQQDTNVVQVPRELRLLSGILLGDRLQFAEYQRQPLFAQKVRVYVEGAVDETDIKSALVSMGVVSPGLIVTCRDQQVRVVDVLQRQNTANSVGFIADQMASLSLSSSGIDDTFVSPPFLCISTTEVEICSNDLNLAQYPKLPRHFAFDQVGGLSKSIALLRSTVQLPLHHANLFSDFGISPPRGILLHGPPGTGKTMLLRCVAHESDAHVLMVNGPSIVSKYLGETENALRDMFTEAIKYQPAIICMDEIDSLAPRRGSDDAGETESRVVATLLTMMDGMGDSGRVVVVGATNRPNSIDPALRRPGRFDQEVEIGIPDVEARAQILQKQLSKMNPERCSVSQEEIVSIASKTHGYVGADLSALCREAVMKAISRGLGSGPALISSLQNLSNLATKVQACDLDAALVEVRPSAMREIFLEMPKVTWNDISGQEDLKQKLTEVVQLPLEAADTFTRLGISSPKGVLLYGPPGCSKTLTAKALAHESGLNFLAVKGPEILNKFVGESERTVREIFRKARAAAPSIIFFDEIDALASSRDEVQTSASQNVLTSLLNEIDGVEELNGVIVVAATNRPTEIDAALLRPGRLDRHIYVAPPDFSARLNLIENRCKKFHVESSNSLFARLADSTDGCSGAEVALLCQEAGLAAIMEDKHATSVKEHHFEHALMNISKGITPEMLEYYRAFAGRSGLEL